MMKPIEPLTTYGAWDWRTERRYYPSIGACLRNNPTWNLGYLVAITNYRWQVPVFACCTSRALAGLKKIVQAYKAEAEVEWASMSDPVAMAEFRERYGEVGSTMTEGGTP